MRLRITDRGLGLARIELLTDDPLVVVLPPVAAVRSALSPITLGVTEDGHPLTLDLLSSAHLIVQGATGSGKSVGCYSLLGQLAAAPDVRVTGSDVSGLLLAPWVIHPRHAGHQVLGTGNPLAHVELFERLVAEMDKTIARIPAGRDSVVLGPDQPITLIVVEEYPGLLRLLDSADPKLGKRARMAVARLLAEGRKAGYRVLLIVQRADAAIVGAYERGQASHRVSFRVDTLDALRMLHPDATGEVAERHATALSGIALATAPGLPLTRLRAPHVDYAGYCAAVGVAA
ncbi:MAG TPA: FtsK/SpoIIIE domain-containing protein [Pseudonocardia sp.]